MQSAPGRARRLEHASPILLTRHKRGAIGAHRRRAEADGNGYLQCAGAVGEQAGARGLRRTRVMDANHMAAGRMHPGDDVYQADHEAHGYPSGQADYQYDDLRARCGPASLRMNTTINAPSSRRRVGDYGDCWRICFGVDWHCWGVWLSRVVWLIRFPATAARYQSGRGTQQSCASNKRQGRAIE